ncbi:MAG: hypothetical protein MUP11_05355, partial [Anaerolineales bacterium]|nr:hypothetical protein [Anaerolineales bacterium]
DYLDHVDQIHLNWTPSLNVSQSSTLEEISNLAILSLDEEIEFFWSDWLKPKDKLLVLRIAYPSVSGWVSDCNSAADEACYPLASFTEPGVEIPDIETGFSEQALVYQALISSAVKKSWVSGIISRGYYAPVILHDKSISIHGKPAEDVLRQWFMNLR